MSPEGLIHHLPMQFFVLGSPKIDVFETYLFDIVITRNDQPRFVKHVLGRIYLVFTFFGYWPRVGGCPKGLVHNLLMQFFTLDSSKIAVSETYFFDIVII